MYYPIFAIFYLISLLPFWALYVLSDFLYFVLYTILKYRVNVTRQNLAYSLPEKSDDDRLQIEQKFYKNLCDSIVETIKLMSISKASLSERMTANWQEINKHYESGKVVQGHLSHLFNWEWGTVVCNWNTPFQFVGPYNPISNKAFERLMKYMRSRSGTIVINMNELQQEIATHQQNRTLWGFIADQNPSEPRRSAWANFLNRETAFYKGAELIARRYNNVVIFGRIVKLRRGYYNIELKTVIEDAKQTKDGEITEMYVRYLEDCIRQQPENWLWSHRRWKHSRLSN
jgi:Kdo2-lipid IVA lauroyltransferase/acyltransferase